VKEFEATVRATNRLLLFFHYYIGWRLLIEDVLFPLVVAKLKRTIDISPEGCHSLALTELVIFSATS
jgi:hypothetical protein